MTDAADLAENDRIGVLICDDLDAMRALLRVVIQLRPGLSVVGEARDGNEAIEQAERLQPDVILLDLAMPNLTGFAALPRIREVAPAASIIVLSGFVSTTTSARVLALGAARFVEKGAAPAEIALAIEEVVAADRTARRVG